MVRSVSKYGSSKAKFMAKKTFLQTRSSRKLPVVRAVTVVPVATTGVIVAATVVAGAEVKEEISPAVATAKTMLVRGATTLQAAVATVAAEDNCI